MTAPDRKTLEARLDDFNPAVRRDSLAALASLSPPPAAPPVRAVNMHCHSFFSYNALGYSPSHLAWEARKRSLYAVGLCDFDVLDGMEEFQAAGLTLGLRVAVHMETRAFFHEFADAEINSPGEPGVTYIMGCGFYRYPLRGTPQAEGLEGFREAARRRNQALVDRINRGLAPVRVGYEREVLPRTPGGTPTERHIIAAYIEKSTRVFPEASEFSRFWAAVLKKSPEEVASLHRDPAAFADAARAALAKQGGVGYEAPSAESFPPVDRFIKWVASCDALPTVTWLDGTSRGESRCREMLELLTGKGCLALNIIPERNWNFSDPEKRRVKTERLEEVVCEARRLDLPINIGTEMNKPGLPFHDDLQGPVLRRYAGDFLHGAQVMIGHGILGKYCDLPYPGEAAAALFPTRAARNLFFARVGALPPLTEETAGNLVEMGPEKAFREINDQLASAKT